MELSIVIPAYNEEHRLGRALEEIRLYLDKHQLEAEVIVVDDGSQDKTRALVQDAQKDWPVLKLISNGKNKGKGYSVKVGALASGGREVLFTDADLSTPIEEVSKLQKALREGAGLAIASRDLPDSKVEKHQPWYREAMGKVFNKLIRLLTGLPFHDTQCGFKLLTQEASRKIFPKLTLTHFAFDVEILWLAGKFKIPVRWVDCLQSRVDPVVDSVKMLLDIIRIRLNDSQGKYS